MLSNDKILELFGADILAQRKAKKKDKSREDSDIEDIESNVDTFDTLPAGRKTKAVKLAAVRMKPDNIKKIAAEDITAEMAQVSVVQTPAMIEFVPESQKSELLCKRAIFEDPALISHVPTTYSGNLSFLVDIVKRRPDLFDALESRIAALSQ